MFLEILNDSGQCDATLSSAIKECHKLSTSDWVKENRWLLHQEKNTQQNILFKLHENNIPISKIESRIVVEVVHRFILSDFDAHQFIRLQLPIRAHTMLLHKLYSSQTVEHTILKKATHCIFQNIIRRFDSAQFIFQRGNLLFFYESLYSLYSELSSVHGSERFAILTECLAVIPTLLRRSPLTGYKLSVFKRIHKTIILGIFDCLCIYGHFKDIDLLFHSNRGMLRGKVQKWVLSVSDTDAGVLWQDCPNVKQLCIANTLKWKSLRTHTSSLWALCKASIPIEMLTIEDTLEYSEKTLSTLAENSTHTFHALMRQFTRDVQRKILLRYVHSCQQPEPEPDTDTALPGPGNDSFLCQYILQYQKFCLIKCDNHPLLMKFYVDHGHEPLSILCSLMQVTSISEKHLQQWCDVHTSVPLYFFQYVLQRISTCLRIHKKKHNGLNDQSMRVLNEMNTTLGHILKFSLTEYDAADTIIERVSTFLNAYEDYLSLYRPANLCRFICCVVCIHFMNTLPIVANNCAGETVHNDNDNDNDNCECAICYNEIQSPLRRLPCGHTFHCECVMQSIQHLPHQKKEFKCIANCPYCVTPILPEETIGELTCDKVQHLTKWLYDI